MFKALDEYQPVMRDGDLFFPVTVYFLLGGLPVDEREIMMGLHKYKDIDHVKAILDATLVINVDVNVLTNEKKTYILGPDPAQGYEIKEFVSVVSIDSAEEVIEDMLAQFVIPEELIAKAPLVELTDEVLETFAKAHKEAKLDDADRVEFMGHNIDIRYAEKLVNLYADEGEQE